MRKSILEKLLGLVLVSPFILGILLGFYFLLELRLTSAFHSVVGGLMASLVLLVIAMIIAVHYDKKNAASHHE